MSNSFKLKVFDFQSIIYKGKTVQIRRSCSGSSFMFPDLDRDNQTKDPPRHDSADQDPHDQNPNDNLFYVQRLNYHLFHSFDHFADQCEDDQQDRRDQDQEEDHPADRDDQNAPVEVDNIWLLCRPPPGGRRHHRRRHRRHFSPQSEKKRFNGSGTLSRSTS